MSEYTKRDNENFAQTAGRYVEEKEIFSMFNKLLQALVIAQPKDPLEFMIEKLTEAPVPKIIIVGPPAAGKGTQCAKLVEALGVVHISTGDLLRAAVKEGSKLGTTARPYMDAGGLVPDEIMIGLVQERLRKDDCVRKGWLLDGFPRTLKQANALQSLGINPEFVLVLEVPDEVLIERAVGRRFDPVTKELYHMQYNPPPNDPAVRARLVQRDDDTVATVANRLRVYQLAKSQVLEAYKSHLRINGNQPADAVFAEIRRLMQRRPVDAAPKSFRVMVVGPPGSGKTALCERLAQRYGAVHVSARTVLAREIARNSALGKKAKRFINDNILPEELAIEAVILRIGEDDCANQGWILDGYPTLVNAASALDAAGIVPNRVVLLDVPETTATDRIVHLATDPTTGATIRLNTPGLAKAVASRAAQRPEHVAAAVTERLNDYTANIGGVLDFYAHVTLPVDAATPEQSVFELAQAIIDAPLPGNMPAAKRPKSRGGGRPRATPGRGSASPTFSPTASPAFPAVTDMGSPRRSPRRLADGARVVPQRLEFEGPGMEEEMRRAQGEPAVPTRATSAGKGKGAAAAAAAATEAPKELLHVCLVGPPGSGKTTQARRLASKLGLVHVEPHALLAQEVERGTPLGRAAERFMHATRMPDQVVAEVIKHRLEGSDCVSKGWLIDGFPENGWMAEHLQEQGIMCNRYIVIDVAETLAKTRLLGRLIDPETGNIYHEKLVPAPTSVLDRLERFEEDEELRVNSRITQYRQGSKDAHDFHSDLFTHVDGSKSVDEVAAAVEAALAAPPHEHVQVVDELHDQLRILVVGPPGAGSSTQAAVLAQVMGVGLISPLSVLERHVEASTDLGLKARPYIKAAVIPDDLLIEAVYLRLDDDDCRKGWVLDGFPNTRWNAEMLNDAGVRPHRVVVLQTSDETATARAAKAGRDADKHDAALLNYRKNISAMTDYFKKILVTVPADGDPNTVSASITDALRNKVEAGKVRVIIVGPPGSGSSAIAAMAAKKFNLPLVTPLDILAKEITAQTDLGRQAEPYINATEPPHDLLLEAVRLRLERPDTANGWILDEFPNTAYVAQLMERVDGLKPDRVFLLEATDRTCVQRAEKAGRDMDKHGAQLLSFRNNVKAFADHYQKVLTRVNAELGKDQVFAEVDKVFAQLTAT